MCPAARQFSFACVQAFKPSPCPVHQLDPGNQRSVVAGAILFLPAGRPAPLGGHTVRRAQSRARADCPFQDALNPTERLRNPVRARIVLRAEDYPWSSAAAHCGLRHDPLLSALPEARPMGTADWSKWLEDPEDEKMLATIRLHTRTGRPAGCKEFIAGLESRLGRRLQARSVGRPRRKTPK